MNGSLNFEAESFSGYSPSQAAGEFEKQNYASPVTLRMRPIRARILWPALGFPAVISPQAGSSSKPFDTDTSRGLCVLILSNSPTLAPGDAAQYLRVVPWSQRARRKISTGQAGTFNAADMDVREVQLWPVKDDQCDGVVFGGTGRDKKNPITVGLSRNIREFYSKNGLHYLHEIRLSESASAKLAEGQYQLFWNNDAPEGESSDEMKLLIEAFAKPQRRKLGAKWASMFEALVKEYRVDYGALNPPYQQGKQQNPLTEVLHPVFVTKQSDPLRIAHVTDTHVDVRWDVYEANLKAANKLAGVPFNNCNKNFTKIYDDAKKQSDVILLTGDLIDYGRGHIGPGFDGRFLKTLGKDDHYLEDRNWFLFYSLLASGDNYKKPSYTILGNHDWRLNPYPPFAPGAPEVGELFDAANYRGGNNDLVELLKIAHGPGHEQKYSYSLETESFLEVAGRGVLAFFGHLTQDGSPVQTRIESVLWYLLLINPFLDYSVTLPGGQQLLMLDFAKDEELQNQDEPKTWRGFGPRAAKCPTNLQKWMIQNFMDTPGRAKVLGVHVPPMGPYPTWTDGELIKGAKTYRSGEDSRFRMPDGRILKVPEHSMFAIRPKDQPHGVAADYGSFAREPERDWFISNASDARHGIRLILSGHIHRRGLFTVMRTQKNWMLQDVSAFNTNNIRWPLAATSGSHTYLGPLYVNTTSAGPRGNEYGVQYKSMEPGWSWVRLASDGTIGSVTHVPPRNVLIPSRSAATTYHEFEYLLPTSNTSDYTQPYQGESMSSDLNFEALPFASYKPVQDEAYEQLEDERFVHSMGGGHVHGFHGHGHGRGRWSWLRRQQFGSGDSTQDQQSVGWAQNCLSQITGGHVSQSGRMGHSTRRAIRKFQMQQQLPPTGRLDRATMSALQQSCGDGDSDGGDQGDGDNEAYFSGPAPLLEAEYDTPPTPPAVWFDRPLPASENGRFLKALANLEQKIVASGDPRMWRYLCWIKKLKQPDVDDRVVRWGAICPGTGVVPRPIVGACDITEGYLGPAGADRLWKTIKSVADVDKAGQSLGIITYLKADIVVSYEMTALPLDNLRATHDGVQRAIEKLDKWANIGIGGSSSMPRAYVSIKDWIGGRQRDQKSVYSCL
jgi:hypothetical protein